MSDEDWSHTNKEWRETLEIAKALGWSCRKTSNHNIRYLECPAAVCKQLVFSTGNATESVARGTRTKVRGCPHRNITSPLAAVNEFLVSAERLLTAAEALVIQGEEDKRLAEALELADFADGLIHEAERQLDKVSLQASENGELAAEVEQKLSEALDKHERGQKVKTEASESFDKAAERREAAEHVARENLQPSEVGFAPSTLIRTASSSLRSADLNLRQLPQSHAQVAVMSDRVAEMKSKCEALRQRLPA